MAIRSPRPSGERPGRGGGRARSQRATVTVPTQPSADGDARPARHGRFTNRAAVLAVVFAILVISYASSMKAYFDQRAHIAGLEEQIAASEASIDAAEREKRRWRDPAYVEAQARTRFGWVRPGETSYLVLGDDGKPLDTTIELTDPATVAPPAPVAWWTTFAASVDAADHPEKYIEPTPADRIRPEPKKK